MTTDPALVNLHSRDDRLAEIEYRIHRAGVGLMTREVEWLIAEVKRLRTDLLNPIPMLLNCPNCHIAHVDRGDWAVRLHRTHLCEGCAHEWRPSERYTVGVSHFVPHPDDQHRQP